MSGNPFRDPMPGTTYNGFSQSDAPGPPDGLGWDDGLRLTRDPADVRPRRRGPTRGALMAGWAAVLGVALGVAYVTQPNRQLDAWADIPPPKSEVPPPPAPPPEPPRAAPIPVEAPELAPGATAGQADASAPGAEAPAGSAVAAPTAPAAGPAMPPPLVAKAQLQVDVAEDAPAVKPAKAAARKASTPIDEPSAKPVKTAARKASPETDEVAAKPVKTAAHKPAPAKPLADEAGAEKADAKAADLATLRHRMGQAYADAVKAGMPKSVLKARQAQWAVLRAKAQDKGPAAVAALYKKRAAQLEALTRQAERRRGAGRREG